MMMIFVGLGVSPGVSHVCLKAFFLFLSLSDPAAAAAARSALALADFQGGWSRSRREAGGL